MSVLGALALVLVVGATSFFARAVLYCVGEGRTGVTLALSVGLLYAVPAALGRLFDDMVGATLALGVLAVFGVVGLWRASGPAQQLRSGRWPRWLVALAIVIAFFVGWVAIEGYLWDELNAHNPFSLVLARGIFPPEHPLFPGEPLRYHYGCDVLMGQVVAFTGLRIDHATDVVTIVVFVVLLAVAKDAGEALAGPRGGALALVLVPLGAGTLQVFLFGDSGWFMPRWSLVPFELANFQPPPEISNYFQHPQGVGMPLSLAVGLLYLDERGDPGRIWARRAVAAAFLGILALGQFLYFGLAGLALTVAAFRDAFQRRSIRALLAHGGLLLAALVLARLQGGIFAPGPKLESLIIFGQGLFADLPGPLWWRLFVYTAPLVLVLPVAIRDVIRDRSLFRTAALTIAIVGLLVPNLMTYRSSWDVVKFFAVGGLYLNLLYAEVIARYVRRRAGVAVLVGLATLTSAGWLVRLSVLDGRFGVPKMQFPPPSPIGLETAKALAPHLRPRDRVLTSGPELARAGGILTPGFDWRAYGEGFIIDRDAHDVLHAKAASALTTLDEAELDAVGVAFVVLAPQEEARLGPGAKQALLDPSRFVRLFEVSASDGRRIVYQRSRPDPR